VANLPGCPPPELAQHTCGTATTWQLVQAWPAPQAPPDQCLFPL